MLDKTTTPFLSLPQELYPFITDSLSYPDLLALKHTHSLFYYSLNTGIKLKVAWLLDRKQRGLRVPQGKCVLRTDESFCTSGRGEVSQILRSRRQHKDCVMAASDGNRGKGGNLVMERKCEVLLGSSCAGPRELKGSFRALRLKRFSRLAAGRVPWIIAILAIAIGIRCYG